MGSQIHLQPFGRTFDRLADISPQITGTGSGGAGGANIGFGLAGAVCFIALGGGGIVPLRFIRFNFPMTELRVTPKAMPI
jgi:hypothetical protein